MVAGARGYGLALPDVTFRMEFLDYCFEVTRPSLPGLTSHRIELDVMSGQVTELANSWNVTE
jgi:hypothetical protein